MTCTDCQTAAVKPWCAYNAKCAGCVARGIARGPEFWECRRTKVQTHSYRELLKTLGLTHEQVKQAFSTDAMNGER